MSVKINTAFVLGTWFGSGRAPVASGTFGSLAALPFACAFMFLGGRTYLLGAAVIIYFIGVWSAGIIMRETNTEDPGQIVIDEVVGQWLALLATPLDPFGYAIAFLLFRFFDILKPWPACWADSKLHSATGVMLRRLIRKSSSATCTMLINRFLMPADGWLSLISATH